MFFTKKPNTSFVRNAQRFIPKPQTTGNPADNISFAAESISPTFSIATPRQNESSFTIPHVNAKLPIPSFSLPPKKIEEPIFEIHYDVQKIPIQLSSPILSSSGENPLDGLLTIPHKILPILNTSEAEPHSEILNLVLGSRSSIKPEITMSFDKNRLLSFAQISTPEIIFDTNRYISNVFAQIPIQEIFDGNQPTNGSNVFANPQKRALSLQLELPFDGQSDNGLNVFANPQKKTLSDGNQIFENGFNVFANPQKKALSMQVEMFENPNSENGFNVFANPQKKALSLQIPEIFDENQIFENGLNVFANPQKKALSMQIPEIFDGNQIFENGLNVFANPQKKTLSMQIPEIFENPNSDPNSENRFNVFANPQKKAISMQISEKTISEKLFEKVKIPFLLFQTWHTKELPFEMKKNRDLIISQNQEFVHFLFDDNDCREFIKTSFDASILEAYDTLVPGAYKADLWRYCILYTYGGIYLDIKFTMHSSFSLVTLTDKEYFVRDLYSSGNGIYNGLMVCYPKNPILQKCILSIVENVKKKYYGVNALSPTGPMLLKSFFSESDRQKFELHLNTKDDIHQIFLHNKLIFYNYARYRMEQKTTSEIKHYSHLWKVRQIYRI